MALCDQFCVPNNGQCVIGCGGILEEEDGNVIDLSDCERDVADCASLCEIVCGDDGSCLDILLNDPKLECGGAGVSASCDPDPDCDGYDDQERNCNLFCGLDAICVQDCGVGSGLGNCDPDPNCAIDEGRPVEVDCFDCLADGFCDLRCDNVGLFQQCNPDPDCNLDPNDVCAVCVQGDGQCILECGGFSNQDGFVTDLRSCEPDLQDCDLECGAFCGSDDVCVNDLDIVGFSDVACGAGTFASCEADSDCDGNLIEELGVAVVASISVGAVCFICCIIVILAVFIIPACCVADAAAAAAKQPQNGNMQYYQGEK